MSSSKQACKDYLVLSGNNVRFRAEAHMLRIEEPVQVFLIVTFTYHRHQFCKIRLELCP